MSSQYTEADIRETVDREAIRDVLMRYAHGIDRCDEALLKSVYWPDGIDQHSDFVGAGDAFVAWVMPSLRALSLTQHFLGNILIRIEGTKARVETYFQAFHRVEKDGAAEDSIVVGRYIDRMERRAKEWRIAHRVVAWDYLPASTKTWGRTKLKAQKVFGARNPDDPSCALFGESLLRAPY